MGSLQLYLIGRSPPVPQGHEWGDALWICLHGYLVTAARSLTDGYSAFYQPVPTWLFYHGRIKNKIEIFLQIISFFFIIRQISTQKRPAWKDRDDFRSKVGSSKESRLQAQGVLWINKYHWNISSKLLYYQRNWKSNLQQKHQQIPFSYIQIQ